VKRVGSRTWLTLAFAVISAVAPGPPAKKGTAATIGVNGEVGYETFGYPSSETGGSSWENFFAANLRGRGELIPDLSYRFDVRAVADDAEFTAGVLSVRNRQFRRPYVSFKELALSYRALPELRLGIGKELVRWSIIEGLQPANLMDPTDQSDPFRIWEEGVWSASLHYEPGEWSVDAVVVPIAFTPSRAPLGRWQIIPAVVTQTQDMPPVQFEETQTALRVQGHLQEWEGALIQYTGRVTDAIFVPQLIFVGGEQQFRLEMVHRYPHLYAWGAQLSRPLGDSFIWRNEAVYYHSPDQDEDDFVHWVTGLEYSYEVWRVVLNYFREDVTAEAPIPVTSKGALRFFRSFLFGEVRYDPGSRWRVTLRGGHDFTELFTLIQPEVSFEIYPDLRIALGGDYIDASKPSSYFYSIRHDSRISARIQYFF